MRKRTNMDLEISELIALAFYFTIAGICLLETILENSLTRRTFDHWLVVGLLISVFWPVVLIVLMLRYGWSRHLRRRGATARGKAEKV